MLIHPPEVFPYISGEKTLSFSVKDLKLLKGLISEIEGYISAFVGYNIAEHYREEITSGNGTDLLLLQEYAKEVISLYIDLNRQFTSETLIPPEEYYLDTGINGIRLLNSEFPATPKTVKVIYKVGWTSEDLPPDLKSVLCSTVANLFDKTRKKLLDVSSHAGLGSSVTYPLEKTFTKQHYAILHKYRVPAL